MFYCACLEKKRNLSYYIFIGISQVKIISSPHSQSFDPKLLKDKCYDFNKLSGEVSHRNSLYSCLNCILFSSFLFPLELPLSHLSPFLTPFPSPFCIFPSLAFISNIADKKLLTKLCLR